MYNAEFTIQTDHKPLKYISEVPVQNQKIQLWALGLSGLITAKWNIYLD